MKIKTIKWRDSRLYITQESVDSDWQPCIITSVGFVLEEDSDKIVLAGDLADDDVSRALVIPKENIEPKPYPWTPKELMEQEYNLKLRELKISRTRASVLRLQITKAYEILENIRFDYLSDTAFRDYIVKAKKNLEGAMSDFLLSDTYWEDRVNKHKKMTHQEYKDSLPKDGENPTTK